MLTDAIRWNILNLLRFELCCNGYKIWTIYKSSSLQSARGQYAIINLLISLIAQLAIQFNFSWLMTFYSIYLTVGMGCWLYRRLYVYHRSLGPEGVSEAIRRAVDQSAAARTAALGSGDHSTHSNGTLKPSKHGQGGAGPTQPAASHSDNTDSLHRQRNVAYRDFQNHLQDPRKSHREFATSLAHLSRVSDLLGSKNLFDEIHIQILATRRDAINIAIRAILLTAVTTLAYFA